jgi:hypothetical protein
MEPFDAAADEARTDAANRFGLDALTLIVANVGLGWFVLAYGVTPFQLVLVFWCECFWIGAFNAVKLLVASVIGNPFENRVVEVSPGAALFTSLFVIFLASSAFLTLLGLMLLAILAANESLVLSSRADEPLNQIGLALGASLVLMAGHAVSFVVNFVLLGEFRNARLGMLVAQPFRRCAALFAAIFISIALIAVFPRLATTAAFGVLVLVAKIAWDLRLHFTERRLFAPATSY